MEAYLIRFFPLALIVEKRGKIIVLKQMEDQSLYNCPMHGIVQMTRMDIFCHVMNYSSKGTIDATFRGAFRRKSV